MDQVMVRDYIEQRVKICYPGATTVYAGRACYIKYNEAGEIIEARVATDAEVQWWMTLDAMHSLREQIVATDSFLRARLP